MISHKELEQQLREAVEYIESLQEAIETGVSDSAKGWIYAGMDKSLEFSLADAKALLEEKEEEDCE